MIMILKSELNENEVFGRKQRFVACEGVRGNRLCRFVALITILIAWMSAIENCEAASETTANVEKRAKNWDNSVMFGLIKKKWEKPCKACVRDRGYWCDNSFLVDGGRGYSGKVSRKFCIERDERFSFLRQMTCKKVVTEKEGCTPARDMMEQFCARFTRACAEYDRVKEMIVRRLKK